MPRTPQWTINIALLIVTTWIFASCQSIPAKAVSSTAITKIESYGALEKRVDEIYRRVCQLEVDCAGDSPIMTTSNGVVALQEKFDPVIEHSEIKNTDDISDGSEVHLYFDGTTGPFAPKGIRWVSDSTLGYGLSVDECHHIWVQEYVGNVAQIGVPVVCLRCLKQDVRTWEWTPLDEPDSIEPLPLPLPLHPILPFDTRTTGVTLTNTSDCEENCYHEDY